MDDKYIGKLLDGRYEILEISGVGGMAVVYKARDRVLNRYVAIKVLKEEFEQDEEFRRRFYNESQTVARLSHHNIVSIYDVSHTEGLNYIVMELIDGISLKEYLQKKGRLSWQEALFFAQQIARALEHAHSRGIIHQDIKPHNILILRDGTAKVTDFGIARFAAKEETRVIQEAIGSVHYISPEQAKGSTIDYRTDLYSLGVVMYEMLTGKLPFEGDTALSIVMQHISAMPLMPSEIVPTIPEGMNEIVMHAMCPTVSRRYSSASELYADLERLKSNPQMTFGYAHSTEVRGDAIEKDETQKLPNFEELSAIKRQQPIPHPPVHEPTPIREREPERYEDKPHTAPKPGQRRRREPEEEEESRFSDSPVLMVAVAVLAIVIIGAAVGLWMLLSGGSGGEKIEVPQFIGQMAEEVRQNPEYSEFDLDFVSRVDTNYTEGQIIEQSVEKGKMVVVNTKIELTYATGKAEEDDEEEIELLDFKDYELEECQKFLDESGILYSRVAQEEPSEDVEEGKVTRTDPAAGEMVKPNKDRVVIYISSGSDKDPIEVPDYIGEDFQDATEDIALKGEFTLAGTVTEDSDRPKGEVTDQSPAPGAMVVKGTGILLTISNGNSPKPEEPDEPEPPSEPQYGVAHIDIPVSGDNAEITVTLNSSGERLYHSNETADGGMVNIRVEGPAGSHECMITVDGQSWSQTVTFN